MGVFDFLKRKKTTEEIVEQQVEEKQKVEEGLQRTRRNVFGQIANLFTWDEISEEFWTDLTDLLVSGDVGINTTEAILTRVRDRVLREGIRRADEAERILKEEMISILRTVRKERKTIPPGSVPTYVILVVGVNGVGKTTTIAKLANYYKREGFSVMIAAGDTFRAGAVDQLKVWGERIGVPVIAKSMGSDPGAVAFEAAEEALKARTQILIVDTAGRLTNKINLMEELKKVRKSLEKQIPGAPHEVMMVLDATTGQNGLIQAQNFVQAVEVNSVVLAKVDGTAKGGIAFAIAYELGIPIIYIGTGEKITDIASFNAEDFVAALFA